jgi:hypothetical protein
MLIIISSKSPNRILYNNISSLRRFYKDEKIVVIDSNSSDYSEYERIKQDFTNIDIHYIKNINYEYGAWKIGYDMYPNYDVYMCIQDSIIIKNYINLNTITDNDAFIFYNYSGFFAHMNIKPLAKTLLENSNLEYNDIIDKEFILATHSSFIVTNNRIKDIFLTLKNPPTDKDGSCSYERIFGLYFILKNINTTDINSYFDKIHGGRY